jgi:predicted nucleic acid-binding protein
MTNYFLDSSALAKRYVIETGTTWLRSIVDPAASHRIMIAQITPVEVVSGVMRQQRESALSAQAAHAARLLIDRHASREYMIIGLTPQIVQQAENLLEAHPLRAYDSIQLASAIETDMRLTAAELESLIFVSADSRLVVAAKSEGLLTEDPNNHP